MARKIFFLLGCVSLFIIFHTVYEEHKQLLCQRLNISLQSDKHLKIHPFITDEGMCAVVPQSWSTGPLEIKLDDHLLSYKWLNDTVVEYNLPFCVLAGEDKIIIKRTILPFVAINTESGTMDDIDADEDKSTWESGTISTFNNDGGLDYEGNLKKIYGRGNSTWKRDIKKPYNINIGTKSSLLGMMAGKKYCILTSNSERSNSREYIASWFSKKMGMIGAVDCNLISLYLNGNYHGVCLITNKICRGNAEFLLERSPKGKNNFFTEKGLQIRVKEPEFLSIRKVDSIRQFLNEAIEAVCSESGFNKKTGKHYSDYIDVESFAKYYLIQDFLYNVDLGNFYVCGVRDSIGLKLYAGTCWDLSASMGKSFKNSIYDYPEVFFTRCGFSYYKDEYRGIIGELFKHSEFNSIVDSVFRDHFYPVAKEFLFGGALDSLQCILANENELDYQKWPDGNSGDLHTIKPFLQKRLTFFHREMIEKKKGYCSIYAKSGDKRVPIRNSFEFRVKKGNFFIPPPMPGKLFKGWYNEQGENVSKGFYVTGNSAIHGKYLQF